MGCCPGVPNRRLLRNKEAALRTSNRYSAIALSDETESSEDRLESPSVQYDPIYHGAQGRKNNHYKPGIETIRETKGEYSDNPDDTNDEHGLDNTSNSLAAKQNIHDCTMDVKRTIVYVPMAHQVLPTFLSFIAPHTKQSLAHGDDTVQKAVDFLRDCVNTSRYTKTFQVSEWLGDADRKECDENRVVGRTCSIWQPDYSKWITQKRQEHRRVYAISLHTFPEAEGIWGTIDQDQDNSGFSDLVIIDNCLERNKHLASSISLRNFLNERKFYVSIVKNTATVNDIDREILKQTVERALAWEINESLDDDKLNKLSCSIIEWLSLEVLNRNQDIVV